MKRYLSLASLIIASMSLPAQADENKMLVDEANTFSYGSFHGDDKKDTSRSFSLFGNRDKTAHEVSERFTLGTSDQAHFTPVTVIAPLTQAMARACPKGWSKTGERVIAQDQDYVMYYQFTCEDKSP